MKRKRTTALVGTHDADTADIGGTTMRLKTGLKKAGFTLCAVLLLEGHTTGAWADQTIKNLHQGVKANLSTDLRNGTDLTGQPFEASLPESLHYKEWTLPSGTRFHGEVVRTKASKHFGRPGYMVLNVKEAQLPNGQTISLDSYKPRNTKVYNTEVVPFSKSLAAQLPFTAMTTGISVPLHVAADISSASVLPINIGARAVAGSLWGLYDPKRRNLPPQERIVYGLNQGLGVITVNNFLSKRPEPDFKAGDPVPLYFNRAALKELFTQGNTQVNAAPSSGQNQGRLNTGSKLSLKNQTHPAAQEEPPQPPPASANADFTPIQP
jgi:hypothetical protein